MTVNSNSQANGGNIDQWAKTAGAKNQQFRFVYVADLYYKLQAVNSGKCADVANASLNNGANVQQWDCSGGANQLWKFVKQIDGTYMVVCKSNGKALDVSPSSLSSNNLGNGANVQQWDAYGGENQKWWINPVQNTIKATQVNSFQNVISPNPAKDNAKITVEDEFIGGELLIANQSGITLYKIKIKDNNTNLDISAFPQGLYIVQLHSNAGEVSRLKLIVP